MSVATIEGETHALYRFFDAAERLLYVGITANPARRFGQHSSSKPWWHEVANIRIETYANRAAVLAAERAAIQNEKPLHNIVHVRTAMSADEKWQLSVDAATPGTLGDAKILHFCQLGQWKGGRIVEIKPKEQQTDTATRKPAYWDDAKTEPKWQLPIILQTGERDPSDPLDDGRRTLYVEGGKERALRERVKETQEKLRPGGELLLAWTSGGKNGNPKQYTARYTPTGDGDGWGCIPERFVTEKAVAAPTPERREEAQYPSEGGGEWPVAVGDVVALGLANRECPVGLVKHISVWGPRIALMSFWDGTFDVGYQTVRWEHIEDIRHARLKYRDELDSTFDQREFDRGYKFFHTEPLGEFQILWTQGPEAAREHRIKMAALKHGR